jgi:sarcosine oxidase, subunit alpha
MDSQRRLPSRPTEKILRSNKVAFTFDGRSIEAYDGDTLASALCADGVTMVTRSFKYHRPRGLLCLAGRCPNCLVNVDGEPNVRSCTTRAKQGMNVQHQNAWPSLEYDVSSLVGRFLPKDVGFYYKTFIHPKWAWPIARKFIRRMLGIGKVNANPQSADYEHVNKHTDVLVVGGGPAGLSAAIESAKLGSRVLLVEEQLYLGGHLCTKPGDFGSGEFSGLSGLEIASKLSDTISSLPNIEVFTGATCFGVFEGGLLGIAWHNKMIRARAKKIIVCTGCRERPFIFTNNDLPGIMLGSGIQKLVNLYSVLPGKRFLVVTNNDYGYEISSELLDAGAEVAGIVDARSKSSVNQELAKNLERRGIQVLDSHTIVEAKGGKKVEAAIIGRIDESGDFVPGSNRAFKCDTIALSVGFEPENELLYQAGCEMKFDDQVGEFVPVQFEPGVYAAGDVTGIHDLEIARIQGKIAGLQAALDIAVRRDPKDLSEKAENIAEKVSEYSAKQEELTERYKARVHPVLLTSTSLQKEKKIACVCEDVTEQDLKEAIEEGFDEIETLKRYSTFSMGPCQGKMCHFACTAVAAKVTGSQLAKTVRTTSRPPYHPVKMGMVVGSPKITTKLTSMHQKHVSQGAKLMEHGEWKRPYDYGSVQEEYKAIRERAGLIDVSTLGRFEVRGRDAPMFLDMIFGNVYSNLKIGKVRYAPAFTEGGIVLDDGVIARLAEDYYLVTSSTGNTEFFEEYLKWWLEWSRWYAPNRSNCLHITNLTSGLAAINVAGPKSRDLLSKLTDANLSSQAFPYMSCAKTSVAGVPSILLRIGFVGEMGWEVHFPAEYGEFIWDKLIEIGRDYGARPVGVEAMRILRLEKGIIWTDVDTDRASDALSAGLSWSVKFDKEDFIGKHYLLRAKQLGRPMKLIGFVGKEGASVETGSLIMQDGKIIGRVTSGKFSWVRGRYVGLGWAPPELAKEGTTIKIKQKDRLLDAEVVSGAFYDPEGVKLRA